MFLGTLYPTEYSFQMYELKIKTYFIRGSFSLSRKFGKSTSKYYGVYRFGFGYSFILGGSQEAIAYPDGGSAVEYGPFGRDDMNLSSYIETYFEYGFGAGYRINKKFDVELSLNSLYGLFDLDKLGESVLKNYKKYSFTFPTRYRTISGGFNIKLNYHFLAKEKQVNNSSSLLNH